MTEASPVCFVVMPFGKKPLAAADGIRTYDFDKVYRVIIKRAVQQAGLRPIRADERVSSALIHSEMFTDLRDQPIVLADLSNENPNVYYELGIRHVMSPSGTVLMCRNGSNLPFDIRLSRVVFYDYDGTNLDWEEVERVVGALQMALEKAREGEPDSPVHALLDPVMRVVDDRPAPGVEADDEGRETEYERLMARQWFESGSNFAELAVHRNKLFGCRALAYYCMLTPDPPEDAEQLAVQLKALAQFSLAKELFEYVRARHELSEHGLQIYASAVSEARPSLAGANEALDILRLAHERLCERYPDVESGAGLVAIGGCLQRLAGMHHWRWLLSRQEGDLETAIDAHAKAIATIAKARELAQWHTPGDIGKLLLRQLFLLRMRDGNARREDVERNIEAIIQIKTMPQDEPDSISWLRWYQAIALADAGYVEAAQRRVMQNLFDDAQLMQAEGYWHIGRWQYRNIRRFIDLHSRVLRNPSVVGLVGQALQTGEKRLP